MQHFKVYPKQYQIYLILLWYLMVFTTTIAATSGKGDNNGETDTERQDVDAIWFDFFLFFFFFFFSFFSFFYFGSRLLVLTCTRPVGMSGHHWCVYFVLLVCLFVLFWCFQPLLLLFLLLIVQLLMLKLLLCLQEFVMFVS